MNDIVLIGGGGHCRSVIDVLESTGQWNIVGVVEAPGSHIVEVMGYRVIGNDDDLKALCAQYKHALITIGQIKTYTIRQRLFALAKQAGFVLPSVVSPQAHLARGALLDEGSVVMHSAHVGPNARIGKNSIVNTRALIEHDSIVGSHCHVATSAVINGSCEIGDGCLIGSGAICREGVSVGPGSVVGMGSKVRKNLPERTRFLGERV